MAEISNNDIAARLSSYRQAKEQYRLSKAAIIEAAVILGMEQKDALHGAPQDFLDGYLVARGVKQHFRREENSNESQG